MNSCTYTSASSIYLDASFVDIIFLFITFVYTVIFVHKIVNLEYSLVRLNFYSIHTSEHYILQNVIRKYILVLQHDWELILRTRLESSYQIATFRFFSCEYDDNSH